MGMRSAAQALIENNSATIPTTKAEVTSAMMSIGSTHEQAEAGYSHFVEQLGSPPTQDKVDPAIQAMKEIIFHGDDKEEKWKALETAMRSAAQALIENNSATIPTNKAEVTNQLMSMHWKQEHAEDGYSHFVEKLGSPPTQDNVDEAIQAIKDILFDDKDHEKEEQWKVLETAMRSAAQ